AYSTLPTSLTDAHYRTQRAASHTTVLFFMDTPTPYTYTLSLHDALPICSGPSTPTRTPASGSTRRGTRRSASRSSKRARPSSRRSEEHTSELQSRENLVCRLLLEKKK